MGGRVPKEGRPSIHDLLLALHGHTQDVTTPQFRVYGASAEGLDWMTSLALLEGPVRAAWTSSVRTAVEYTVDDDVTPPLVLPFQRRFCWCRPAVAS